MKNKQGAFMYLLIALIYAVFGIGFISIEEYILTSMFFTCGSFLLLWGIQYLN